MTQAISGSVSQLPPPPSNKTPIAEEKLSPDKGAAANYTSSAFVREDTAEQSSQANGPGFQPDKATTSKSGDATLVPRDSAPNNASSRPPAAAQDTDNQEAINAIASAIDTLDSDDDLTSDDIKGLALKLTNEGFDTSKPLIDVLV